MEYGGYGNVLVAVLDEVFFGQLLKGSYGCNVLNLVTELSVAHGDVLYALLRRKESFDDGY